MADVVEVFTKGDDGSIVIFECPGCGYNHGFSFGGSVGPQWTFNGNKKKPTLSPSILMRTGPWETGPQAGKTEVCHSFLTDGMIRFLGDCTHELANKTVPLKEIAK